MINFIIARPKGGLFRYILINIIKATCDVTAALWCHVVRGCLGDVSNEDLAIIENNQFTNLIE